jgi:hypothetical protein
MRKLLSGIIDVASKTDNKLQRIQTYLLQPHLLDDWFLLCSKAIANTIAANIVDGHVVAHRDSSVSNRSKSAKRSQLVLSQEASALADDILIRGYAESESYFSCIVARAHWDSCWCEEVVVVDTEKISFYAVQISEDHENKCPSFGQALFTLPLSDIVRYSQITDAQTHLYGYFLMEVETMGRTHYILFSTENARTAMSMCLMSQMTALQAIPSVAHKLHLDAAQAFTLKGGRWLPDNRLVLNVRKFIFGDSQYRKVMTSSQLSELSGTLLQEVFRVADADPKR